MTENNEQIKKRFKRLEYEVCFLGATEPPFTGRYWNHFEKGLYKCVVCGNILFNWRDKFRSKSGWPSFSRSYREDSLFFKKDDSLGLSRTEVSCMKCGAHLGHVFDDGPPPTKKRFCINSVSLKFSKES